MEETEFLWGPAGPHEGHAVRGLRWGDRVIHPLPWDTFARDEGCC